MHYNKKMVLAAATLAVLSGALTACGTKGDNAQTQAAETVQTTEAVLPSEVDKTGQESTAAGQTGAAETPETPGKPEKPEKNEVFGEFTAVTLDGENIDQNVFAEADLTMVNVWGTFCGYCIEEMPYLGELNREYKDQGFRIVGILTDVTEPNQEDAVEIVEKTKADYTHILISESLYPSVAGIPLPTTVFLDKNGNNVGEVYAGAKDKATWDAIIQEMLEKVKE